MTRRASAWIAGLFVVCLGCGQGYSPQDGVIVTGRILQGGSPLDVPNREVALGVVEVLLVPLPGNESATVLPIESTLVAVDGSFRLEGPGRGIKPGRYMLVVYQRDKGPGSDMLKGAFSEERSPIEVEIPSDRVGGKHDLGNIELNDYAPASPAS